MRNKLLLSILFFSFSLLTFSQTLTIQGKVTSGDDFTGIPGVYVVIKGTLKGTTTDIDGNYILSGVSPKDTLKFSYIGYEAREIPVGKELQIDEIGRAHV